MCCGPRNQEISLQVEVSVCQGVRIEKEHRWNWMWHCSIDLPYGTHAKVTCCGKGNRIRLVLRRYIHFVHCRYVLFGARGRIHAPFTPAGNAKQIHLRISVCESGWQHCCCNSLFFSRQLNSHRISLVHSLKANSCPLPRCTRELFPQSRFNVNISAHICQN